MFLSQPGSEMLASYHCALITVSIESAMRSRDCSEKLIPSVPMEMPSLTPMVLKRMPTRPAAATPSLTFSASESRCMLHGLPSNQTLAMPTWGLSISPVFRPVAYSIAWDAPCDFLCVICELNVFRAMLDGKTSLIEIGHGDRAARFTPKFQTILHHPMRNTAQERILVTGS